MSAPVWYPPRGHTGSSWRAWPERQRRTGGGLRGGMAAVTMGPGRSDGRLVPGPGFRRPAPSASSRGRPDATSEWRRRIDPPLGGFRFPAPARAGVEPSPALAGRWLEGWVAALMD